MAVNIIFNYVYLFTPLIDLNLISKVKYVSTLKITAQFFVVAE